MRFAVALLVFWLLIAAASFLGARGQNAPFALGGMIFGANILTFVVSALAVARVRRGLASHRKPVLPAIVLALCAAWAIFGVPRQWSFVCRSMQSEAKVNLAYLAQAPGPNEAWPAAPRRYRYEAGANGPRAVGVGEMVGDEWRVGEDGKPTAVTNVCAR